MTKSSTLSNKYTWKETGNTFRSLNLSHRQPISAGHLTVTVLLSTVVLLTLSSPIHLLSPSHNLLLLILHGIKLRQLISMFRLHAAQNVLDERHDGIELRHRQAVLDGEWQQERQHLGRHHLLRHAQLVAA